MDLWYILPSCFGDGERLIISAMIHLMKVSAAFYPKQLNWSFEVFGMAIAIAGVVGPGKWVEVFYDLLELMSVDLPLGRSGSNGSAYLPRPMIPSSWMFRHPEAAIHIY